MFIPLLMAKGGRATACRITSAAGKRSRRQLLSKSIELFKRHDERIEERAGGGKTPPGTAGGCGGGGERGSRGGASEGGMAARACMRVCTPPK